MRQHPIPPVTEANQYRAIGVVRGLYVPAEPDAPTRGVIRTAEGDEIEAVVLGRLLTLMRRHLNPAEPHLWVVYPRCREEGALHLQMVGVWEPSTLSPGEADSAADALPEGDDYFSVRGELIFTRPETGDLVIKVRQQPRPDGSRPIPFKLQLKGTIPLEHLRHFVALELRRQGQHLVMESLEVIGPLAQRGNRGGKGRRGGGDRPGGDRSGAERRGERSGERSAGPERPRSPRSHGPAVSRPGR